MIRSFLVVGGGSAGSLAALILKKRFPAVPVTVVRSPEIGIIGVGESTTVAVPRVLHGYLELDPGEFHRRVQPSWKLGIRFLWGPRPHFDYTFGTQLDWTWDELGRPNGYYCYDDFTACDQSSALMAADRAFVRRPDGLPVIEPNFGYHIDNRRFVAYLEETAVARGVTVLDGDVVAAARGPAGVAGVTLADGRTLTADFYIDSTGFRSLLLGGALEEPYRPFSTTLFCDRAVVGTWPRTDEPVQPYTTAETMAGGWCWRIDHSNAIFRGSIYSSAFTTDADAEAEFRAKNPKVTATRVVPYASGRYDRAWVGNVAAVGNAAGFVEPLESTALAVICDGARILAGCLHEADLDPRPSQIRQYNRVMARAWDTIRDFLGLHYKYNTRYDTPFWRAARADTELGPVTELIEYYTENGPSTFFRDSLIESNNMFGMEGYLAMLVGQKVPHRAPFAPPPDRAALWETVRARHREAARTGVGVAESLDIVRHPDCRWQPGFFRPRAEARLTKYVSTDR